MKKLVLALLLALLPMHSWAQPADGAPVDAQAAHFIAKYWAAWSSPNTVALPFIKSAVGDNIKFYGEVISRDAYVKSETAFAQRWPVRQYTVAPAKQSITCDSNGTTCQVSGIVDWRAASPARQAHSAGASQFSFTLRTQTIDGETLFLITEESGAVLSRDADAAPVTLPATPPVTSAPPNQNAATSLNPVGEWRWLNPDGSRVDIRPDGTVAQFSGGQETHHGNWMSLGQPGSIQITWEDGFVDQWQVSQDGSAMTGHNQYGGLPGVSRLSSAPPEVNLPPGQGAASHQSAVGQWKWFNPAGSVVELNGDGTAIHTRNGQTIDDGHWAAEGDSGNITITWRSGYHDHWQLSADGNTMTGHNDTNSLPTVTRYQMDI